MNAKVLRIFRGFAVAVGLMTVVSMPATSLGDGAELGPQWQSERKGKVEFYGAVQGLTGDSQSTEGIEMDIDEFVRGGVGLGYNFDEHFNVNLDLLFGRGNVTMSDGTTLAEAHMNSAAFYTNLDFNILNTCLTPLVTAGAGVMHTDGDLNGTDHRSENDFSFNVGLGARWDINQNVFLKFVYKSVWLDIEGFDPHRFDSFTLYFGWMF